MSVPWMSPAAWIRPLPVKASRRITLPPVETMLALSMLPALPLLPLTVMSPAACSVPFRRSTLCAVTAAWDWTSPPASLRTCVLMSLSDTMLPPSVDSTSPTGVLALPMASTASAAPVLLTAPSLGLSADMVPAL